MGTWLRDGLGAALVLCAGAVLWYAIDHVTEQEYVAGILLTTTGLALLQGGVDLLRRPLGAE